MFFSNAPKINTQLYNIDDCLKLPAFKAVHEASRSGSVENLSEWDANRKAEWRHLVRDAVINLGGESIDLNFFNEMFGGNIETIDAKNLYTKYNADVDYNIAAQAAATGSAPGAKKWITLARGYHSTNGKYSYPSKGMSLYIYEDGQKLYVEDTDRSVDYAHKLLVTPYRKNYTVNVRKQTPILVMPARIIGGNSCMLPTTTMSTPGYVSKLAPIRLRKDWCTPVDLMKGYEDILQWAIMFDKNGKEIDCWITYEKVKAFEQMQLAENLVFFLGNTIDNPLLLDVVVDSGYTGFDGYLPTIKYAGGFVYDYDPTLGFSLEQDYGQIILRQDSLKETKEFSVIHGKNFMVNMVRNSNEFLKTQPGQIGMQSFKRSPGAVEKYSITSYKAFNNTLHFKEWGSLSDSRLLGNYDMPNMAIMTPTTGIKDSKGRAVSPIEFYVPRGCGENGAIEEHDFDLRDITGCEEIKGWLAKTLMMQVHGAKKHIFINPVVNC
jgi:hypothetical protein